MADEDKDKTATKKTKKKVAKKKTAAAKKVAKKKVAKKKLTAKKAAVKKKVTKKTVAGAALDQSKTSDQSKTGPAETLTEAAAVPPEKVQVSNDQEAVPAARPPTDSPPSQTSEGESATWWLNLALVLVLVAIAALTYAMIRFGDFKGVDMGRIWSDFSPSSTPVQVVEQQAAPEATERTDAAPAEEVMVVEEEVIVTGAPATELQPLPEDQVKLLWEALMVAPDQP